MPRVFFIFFLFLHQEVRQKEQTISNTSDIGRKEAVPLPGPIGGASLSSWKESAGKAEDKKKDDGNLSLGSADEVPTEMKKLAAAVGKPEDNKNLSSADDKALVWALLRC